MRLPGAACEGNDGWTLTLVPESAYTTCPALYGCVEGGFEEAVAALTGAKRALGTAPPSGRCSAALLQRLHELPVGNADTRKKLIPPFMDAAARVGAVYFVIDAGWFRTSGNWSADMGDWEPWDELFGEGGVQGIPGRDRCARHEAGRLALRLNPVGISCLCQKHTRRLLLYRHGHVIGKDRCFMDFRNPAVRAHIRGVFDRLYPWECATSRMTTISLSVWALIRTALPTGTEHLRLATMPPPCCRWWTRSALRTPTSLSKAAAPAPCVRLRRCAPLFTCSQAATRRIT